MKKTEETMDDPGAVLINCKAGRTVLAVLHDMTQVSRHFPESLLLAREVIAWGETSSVVCEENLSRARRLPLAPDPQAITCHRN